MQLGAEFELFGIILIIAGIVLIILGTIHWFSSSNLEQPVKKESKGVILIGPIPIVWGFGTKGKIVAIVLFLVVITIWIILFFL
jgi:uncharacterized protein (TIGR00304 family)